MSKRAESLALRQIAHLHRELAAAYERLAQAAEPAPAKVPPAPATADPAIIESTRRALRKKGIAA